MRSSCRRSPAPIAPSATSWSARCWPACHPSSSSSSSRRRCSTPSTPSCARRSPASRNPRAVLDHLLAANLFVVPLDQQGRWYRYHHQFGAFLRARLASSGPANLRAAHERACRALEDRGDDLGALQQAHGDARRGPGRPDRAGRARSFDEPAGRHGPHRPGDPPVVARVRRGDGRDRPGVGGGAADRVDDPERRRRRTSLAGAGSAGPSAGGRRAHGADRDGLC